MDREHWRALAARHTRCDVETRRCRDCGYALYPCWYRLRADAELDLERERAATLTPPARAMAGREM